MVSRLIYPLILPFKIEQNWMITAGNVQGRNNVKATEVLINKPFLFYVRDTLNDVILSAGKIMEIPKEEDLDVIFNI